MGESEYMYNRNLGKEVILMERKTYEAPQVIEYGSIADRTFQTPGNFKGCQENCHLDPMFTEPSGLASSVS